MKLERRAEIQVPEPRYKGDNVEKKVEAIIKNRLATRRPKTDSKWVRLQLLRSLVSKAKTVLKARQIECAHGGVTHKGTGLAKKLWNPMQNKNAGSLVQEEGESAVKDTKYKALSFKKIPYYYL